MRRQVSEAPSKSICPRQGGAGRYGQASAVIPTAPILGFLRVEWYESFETSILLVSLPPRFRYMVVVASSLSPPKYQYRKGLYDESFSRRGHRFDKDPIFL